MVLLLGTKPIMSQQRHCWQMTFWATSGKTTLACIMWLSLSSCLYLPHTLELCCRMSPHISEQIWGMLELQMRSNPFLQGHLFCWKARHIVIIFKPWWNRKFYHVLVEYRSAAERRFKGSVSIYPPIQFADSLGCRFYINTHTLKSSSPPSVSYMNTNEHIQNIVFSLLYLELCSMKVT